MRKVISVLAAISALLVLGTSCSKENPEEVPEYAIVALANPAAGGSVTGTGTYKEGQKVTLTATANAGYEFEKWNDGVATSTRTITVVADAVYTASFKSTAPTASYTIVVLASPEEGGTVTGSGVYTAGTEVTLTATANEGYEFTQWADGETKATRTVTVTKNASYTATFKSTTPAVKGTFITAIYYGNYYNDNTKNYSLYIDCGEFDEDGYFVSEGYEVAFDLNAPNTSTATALDTGTYNYAEWSSDDTVAKNTFLDGYYAEDYGTAVPTYVYHYIDDSNFMLGFAEGGSIQISKSGDNYTVAGTIEYWDYVTEESDSYTFSYTAEITFEDYSEYESTAPVAVKSAMNRNAKAKYLRKSWKLRR